MQQMQLFVLVHQIINHKKQLNVVIQLSLGALSNKTDAKYIRGPKAVCT